MAFVKLDAGILNSTIWVLRPDLEIFITALLMAMPVELTEPTATIKIRTLDADDFVVPPGWYGLVEAAGPGLVNRAHIEQEPGMAALERLAAPETESRSQEFDGRRMVRINGGYIVLNFMRYRDRDHTAAERQRRLRERRRGNTLQVTRDSNAVTRDEALPSRNITHSRGQSTEGRSQSTESPVPEVEKTQDQLRVEKLFHRRPSTPWDGACRRAWKNAEPAVQAMTDDDWTLLEWFYSVPADGTYRRHDLATLLNNWGAELDRARNFKANGTEVIGKRSSMA